MSRTETAPSPAELETMHAALGSLPPIRYSPPHVYTMCPPVFRTEPRAVRPARSLGRLRLYVHVPFCNYHCNYCFYAVKVGAHRDQMSRYVDALLEELTWADAGTPLYQLFVGGGTPTALPAPLLDRLLAGIFDRCPSMPDIVHTVESSPESMTPEHLDVLHKHGVERVSMGIQTLDDDVLDRVTRGHSGRTALDTCRMIVDAGLILNIDLIYGLPGQTEEAFRRDLERIAAQGVQAVTLYSLRTNEWTPVNRILEDQERLDVARLARWRWFARDAAEALGFTQFRWHSYKRLETRARRHDRKPTFTDAADGYQLGIGLSARSHLGFDVYRNHRNYNEYVARIEAGESPVQEVTHLDEIDRRTMYIARSIGDGKEVSRAAYADSFGRSFDEDYGGVVRRLVSGGLLEDDGERIHLSPRGNLVHDLVTLALYPAERLDLLADAPGA